jgi:small subunit ribosomal protein S9
MTTIPKGERWTATGKRKTSIARVILTPGTGKIYVRKWRNLPKGTDLTVQYHDQKTGDLREEKAVFSAKLEDGQYGVPRTQRAGKKPFRYTPLEEYFGRETLRMIAQQPFEASKLQQQFDVFVNVRGGGHSGQAGAIRHGIARALTRFELSKNPSLSTPSEDGQTSSGPIRLALKRAGLLTRDARIKERKKYGRPAARKRFQYSKR